MSMLGFAAELSLYKNGQVYRGSIETAAGGILGHSVVPRQHSAAATRLTLCVAHPGQCL
jgi:hypothetical protein